VTIAGLEGELLPLDFMEQRLAALAAHEADTALQRNLRRWRRQTEDLGPATAMRALVDRAALPLVALLGLRPSGAPVLHDDHAVIPCRAADEPVPLVVAQWAASPAALWRTAIAAAISFGATWALAFSGTHLTIFARARLHSRRYASIEIDAAADDSITTAILALVCGAAALSGRGAGSLASLIADAQQHEAGVCRSLRSGVLEASEHLLRALAARERTRTIDDVFDQSLTIVYRLLFLLFAEARALVPLWHPVYRDSYSIQSLREASLRARAVGLWDALRAASRMAHGGCRAGDLAVTAFNGRLFSPARTPLAERRGLDDEAARRAIVALSTRPSADGEGRERISYRDLAVEQLGAVYETLLDYTPHADRSTQTRSAGPSRSRALVVSLRPGSGIRKDTGTFYTPQPIVDYLVRDTLAPFVREATPEQILALKVLDPSMGSGAFLVGACRYLSHAYERALVEHGRCLSADLDEPTRAAFRRQIAERCLYGVDLNPRAVQLARLSLWLTTLAGDKPLTFLDHRLRVGDSLAGTWLSLLRTPPHPKRSASVLPLFPEAAATDAIRDALPVRFRLASNPNDTAAQVREKERALAALRAPDTALARWTRIANLWCAAWLANPPVPAGTFAALADTILSGGSSLLSGGSSLALSTAAALLARVDDAAASRRFFQWELEFPEVFFDADGRRSPHGGFDVVVGNPPWDMVRADSHGDRREARSEAAALVRFARDSGVYDARADGHVNRYQLFVERAVALARPGGRIGMVLPSGLVADSGSAALRRLLFSRCAVERIVGFDNRKAAFPIHRSMRFVLLSARTGASTGDVACRFGEDDISQLDRAGSGSEQPLAAWFPVRVGVPLLRRISGEEVSIPDVRSATDLRIAERAAELFAALSNRDGWHARFGRELNATEDRPLLRTDGSGVPVFEGKLVEPFRLRSSGHRWTIASEDAERVLGARVRRPRLAYRDVASPTNKLTLIAAILPASSASTHTLFCLRDPMPLAGQHLLCALMNSLVVNFLVRMRVGTHVTTAIVERLPLPRAHDLAADAAELAGLAQQLSRGDSTPAFARLNALVARAYRLDSLELRHIVSSFPLVPQEQREATVEAFERL
jgi:hypothetical protein